MRDLRELNHFRDRQAEVSIWGYSGPQNDRESGFFRIPVKSSKRPLKVIVSCGGAPGGHGWDHVSVSLPGRCPTWEEMDFVKRRFFPPHEVAMQLHPAEVEHVNYHPYCLHIWRPLDGSLPLPPSILVGLQSMGTVVPKAA